MASAKKPVPEGYHTITPQLTLDDAARAIDWYKKALGAEELGRSNGPDGKVMGAFVDPHGYSWSVATRKEDLTKEEMDLRAQEFFKAFAKKQPQPAHT